MDNLIIKETVESVLKELEDAGDIVITTTIESSVPNKLVEAIQKVSPNLLSPQELGGIINAIYATEVGMRLDDNDFHTHIGLTREQLKAAAKKLECKEW